MKTIRYYVAGLRFFHAMQKMGLAQFDCKAGKPLLSDSIDTRDKALAQQAAKVYQDVMRAGSLAIASVKLVCIAVLALMAARAVQGG